MKIHLILWLSYTLSFLPKLVYCNDTSLQSDIDAMKAVIESFSKSQHICECLKDTKFEVYKFHSESAKHLTDQEMKAISACSQKYEIHLFSKQSESLFIYCYDGKASKLLSTKVLGP